MTLDLNRLDELSRAELVTLGRQYGIERPERMTRVELKDELIRVSITDAALRERSRGWLGVARDLVASVVEAGLHMPDAAKVIRGDAPVIDSIPRRSPVATVTLAEIYATQGHTKRALKMLEQVLEKEPDHEVARCLLDQLKPRSSAPPPSRPVERGVLGAGLHLAPQGAERSESADNWQSSAAPAPDVTESSDSAKQLVGELRDAPLAQTGSPSSAPEQHANPAAGSPSSALEHANPAAGASEPEVLSSAASVSATPVPASNALMTPEPDSAPSAAISSAPATTVSDGEPHAAVSPSSSDASSRDAVPSAAVASPRPEVGKLSPADSADERGEAAPPAEPSTPASSEVEPENRAEVLGETEAANERAEPASVAVAAASTAEPVRAPRAMPEDTTTFEQGGAAADWLVTTEVDTIPVLVWQLSASNWQRLEEARERGGLVIRLVGTKPTWEGAERVEQELAVSTPSGTERFPALVGFPFVRAALGSVLKGRFSPLLVGIAAPADEVTYRPRGVSADVAGAAARQARSGIGL